MRLCLLEGRNKGNPNPSPFGRGSGEGRRICRNQSSLQQSRLDQISIVAYTEPARIDILTITREDSAKIHLAPASVFYVSAGGGALWPLRFAVSITSTP